MSMEVTAVSENNAYATSAVKSTASKVADTKTEDVAQSSTGAEVGATYEKGTSANTGIYSINKMSSEDRAALVSSLKAQQEENQTKFANLVAEMLGKQSKTFANSDDMWKILAGGNFTVDAETKAQAQADISEDGYWGIKQTSQRLFDFASALAGDDVEKMKEMQEAMMKGYKMATGTWGRELPEISKKTIEAANKLFEDYYASKNTVIEE